MTNTEYRRLWQLLYERQGGRCAHCGQRIWPEDGYTTEIAHRIPRGRVRRLLGKEYEWHPDVVALVCTRRGKDCNDHMLIGAAHPVEESVLLQRIREGSSAPAHTVRSE